jgi:hypothetical protein
MAFTSNIEILECFQSKALRMIVDATWYVGMCRIWLSEGISKYQQLKKKSRYSSQYNACLSADLIINLIELPDNRRLQRHLTNYLSARFLVQLLY